MPQAFLQIAIPVLYVYDEGELPEAPPGFDMGLLPVVSRVLKDRAGTPRVTVITGAPVPSQALDGAFTRLALQHANLERASPEAGNLIVAEFVADNFDAEAVHEHLGRLIVERQRELAEQVDSLTASRGRRAAIEDAEPEPVADGGEPDDGEESKPS